MLDLKDLTTAQLSLICRRAGEECVRRIGRIARASDPSDRALQDLLRSMATEAQLQEQAFPDSQDRPGRRSLVTEDVGDFIRGSFPSLSKSLGEGILHRDIALFYAESLEEEASRFHRMLAEHAREAEARIVFSDLSERERGNLRFLREVVLQD